MELKKSLGQHLLNDQKVAERMAKSVDLCQDDIALEIGPGTGILTEVLLRQAKRVLALEKDSIMIRILKNKFVDEINSGHLMLIEVDALDYLQSVEMPEKYKVVASLPYNVGTAIIRLLLENPKQPESIAVLLQYEVAKRMAAKPEEKRSLLANAVQIYGDAKIIEKVLPGKFDPSPKVDSAILQIKNIRKLKELNYETFFKILKFGFSKPRKTILNNLESGKDFLGIDKEAIKVVLNQTGLDFKLRPENLKLEDWISLTKILSKK